MHGARSKTYSAATVCALILLGVDPTDAVAANIGFSVALTPPPPVVEAPPPPPSAAGEVWTPGYWSWDGAQYVWVPGRYVVAPFPGAVWVAGGWVHRGPRWAWADGHWHHR
jgi:WXXGXW repeat (2 copies)